jgi:hypothetical protein
MKDVHVISGKSIFVGHQLEPYAATVLLLRSTDGHLVEPSGLDKRLSHSPRELDGLARFGVGQRHGWVFAELGPVPASARQHEQWVEERRGIRGHRGRYAFSTASIKKLSSWGRTTISPTTKAQVTELGVRCSDGGAGGI